MNRKKILCGLLACVLLGGCAGPIAETQPTPPATEPATQATAPPTAATAEPATEPTAEPTIEPTAEPTIEPTTAPTAPPVTAADLRIGGEMEMYSYADMVADTAVLAALYPGDFRWDSLGTTADGRELLHFVIGDPDAQTRYLFSAGIHGREHMTSRLVMRQTVEFLANLAENTRYGGTSYRAMLAGKCIHVVVMCNPDGISISQFGMEGIQTEAVRQKVTEIAALDGKALTDAYLRRWKANGNGVDLNRNFDALWASYGGANHPSSDRYKGTAPGSEIESKALIDLVEREKFHRVITYHAMGEVIYWYFGQEGALLAESRAYADLVGKLTGYRVDGNMASLDPAGFKDWCLHKEGIVALTVEIGKYDTPLDPAQWPTVWKQNQYIWEETLLA